METSYIEIEVDLYPAEGSLKRDSFRLDNVVCFTQTSNELLITLANGVKVTVDDSRVESLSWKINRDEDEASKVINKFLANRFDQQF